MKRRINWGNVGCLLIMLVSLYVVSHDVFKLVIEPIFTGNLTQFTYFGLITFAISFYMLEKTYDRLFN